MRLWEFARTLLCVSVVGSALLMTSRGVNAQQLLPSSQWTGDADNWSQAGNWNNGVPGETDIASILNGGTAQVSSSVGNVLKLSVRDGTVEFGAGGSLTVAEETVVGEGGTLSFGGGSLTTGALHVPGATIDLHPDLAGNLAFGTSYPLATASSVAGNPGKVTVGGRTPNLPLGQALLFGPTDTGAGLTVGSVPILRIDRLTGNTTIENPAGGGPVELKGYSLTSAGEHLIRRPASRWNSFDRQDVEGWDDSVNNTSESRFTEYNLTGSTTMNSGDSVSIGTPYNGLGDDFLTPAEEDFEISFILGDGRVLDGQIVYDGPPNDFVLTIDPETGGATIGNTSSVVSPFDVASYSITSSSGSLLPDNFTGIGEEGWTNANPQTTGLAELNLTGSKVFSENVVQEIGNIFDPAGAQDLRFQYSVAAGFLRTGSVIYGTPAPVINFLEADFNQDGIVNFTDFLVLSTQFNQTVDPPGTPPDINGDGTVNFPDFLVLSTQFNMTSGGAAAVPEPAAGILAFIGFLGMLKFRKRAPHIAIVLLAVGFCATTQESFAVDFDTRFIRIHPDSPNNAINNIVEARGIVNGTVLDVIKNEDLTGKLDIIDLAGGLGQFTVDNPYLNGVNDETMDNFLQYVSGVIRIPEGQWAIGCGSDDGCLINMPGVTFDQTFNENGPTTAGDGEIIFNLGRGHDWTFGNFTVGAGGVETGFEALFNEGGGGDSFEVGISDLHLDPAFDPVDNTANRQSTAASLLIELTDGEFGWEVTGAPFMANSPADFNGDGVVNDDDADELRTSFGEGGAADIDGSGIVDFHDLAIFFPIYLASQPAPANSVPEPGCLPLILLGAIAMLGLRRRRK